jgi:hypothetical protein
MFNVVFSTVRLAKLRGAFSSEGAFPPDRLAESHCRNGKC